MAKNQSTQTTKLVVDFGDMYDELRQAAFDAHQPMAEIVRQSVGLWLKTSKSENLPQMLADLGWPYRETEARS